MTVTTNARPLHRTGLDPTALDTTALDRARADLELALERNELAEERGAVPPVGRGALIVLRQRVEDAADTATSSRTAPRGA